MQCNVKKKKKTFVSQKTKQKLVVQHTCRKQHKTGNYIIERTPADSQDKSQDKTSQGE